MKVAVTGGTGFIGGRVVRHLRARGHEVVCLVRKPAQALALVDHGAHLAQGDILDRASMDAAFAGCEGVMHIPGLPCHRSAPTRATTSCIRC